MGLGTGIPMKREASERKSGKIEKKRDGQREQKKQ